MQLSSLSQRITICLLFKYILMISYLGSNVSLCEEFAKSMHNEFEMSKMGELNFFLGF